MSDNKVKDFIYEEMFSTATEAFDLFNKSINTAYDYDAFGDQKIFSAIVLTKPIVLSFADLTATSKSGIKVAQSVSKFAFKARITDSPSPHWYLPNPCKASMAKDPDKQLRRILLHTTFISQNDYKMGVTDMPKIGDRVFVQLTKNVFSYNIQFGEFLSIDQSAPPDKTKAAIDECSTLDTFKLGAATTIARAATSLRFTAKPPSGKVPTSKPIDAKYLTKHGMAPEGASLKKEKTAIIFGDSQANGSFGKWMWAKLQGYGGTVTRLGKHSTQPRDWRRCVGDGSCTPSSVADVAKVKKLWELIDAGTDLIVISLAGNGISYLSEFVSELQTALKTNPAMVIWQGAPPPMHQKEDGIGTTYYGDRTKYEKFYSLRNAYSNKVKEEIKDTGWNFIDPYEHLLLSDGVTAGYRCGDPAQPKITKCDGVHLPDLAATRLISAAYPSLLKGDIFVEHTIVSTP